MRVSKKQQQVIAAEGQMMVAGYTDVKNDGRLSKHEKKELKLLQKARGLKATGTLNKKTRKALATIAKKVGHYDAFVLGSKSVGTLQAEKRLKREGKVHGPVDGILDKKSLKGIKQLIAGQKQQDDAFDNATTAAAQQQVLGGSYLPPTTVAGAAPVAPTFPTAPAAPSAPAEVPGADAYAEWQAGVEAMLNKLSSGGY
ncbi:MAG: hypothetical protein IPJ65_12660 [Archangiaceae bacterium]|nr:hypothetical protein [Archangiaceae bacterium]